MVNYSFELVGWEDGFMSFKDVLYDWEVLRNLWVYGYVWNNIWEWGSGKWVYELVNFGYEVNVYMSIFVNKIGGVR